jgi:hypothetical protein
MPREVRLVILCGGLVVGGLLGTDVAGAAEGAVGAGAPGRVVILGTLGIIALGATVTVIQRILRARGPARSPAGADPAAHDSNGEPTSRVG